jgi:uncharacterized protein YecT (DUF1311 family)
LLAAAARGQPSSPLDECSDRSPTVAGIRACLDQMFQQADAELRLRAKAVLARMREVQKQTGSPRAAQTFIAAQKEFRAYRKAHCDWCATAAQTEQAAETLRRDCAIRLTRNRVGELATLLPADGAGPKATEAESVPAEALSHALFGVEWRLVRVVKDGRQVPLAPESRVVLMLSEGGSVTGRTSGSIYSGRYVLRDGNRIEWLQRGFSVERTSGRFDVSDPDESILDDMLQTTRLWVESPGLILDSGDGSVTLVFAR